MPTFISLLKFTQQGESTVKDTCKRAAAFRAGAAKRGVTVKGIYWTMGEYDGVLLIEAPDDETATAALLSVGVKGNVSTHTLRAFNEDEMPAILDLAFKK